MSLETLLTSQEAATIVEALPWGLLRVDRQGGAAWANPSFHALFPTAPAPAGQPVSDLLPAALEGLLKAIPPGGVELPLPRLGRMRVRRLPLPDGTLLCFEHLGDCLPPRALQDATVEEAALRTMDAVVWAFDTEGSLVFFNEAAERLSGWTFAELAGSRAMEVLIPSDERDMATQNFAGLISGRPTQCIDCHWQTRDGRRLFLSWSCSVLRDTEGAPRYVLGTGIDRTRERQAEEGRESMLRTGEDAVVTVDRRGRIVEWNQAATQTFGYERCEALGRSLSLLIPAEHWRRHSHGFARTAEEGLRESTVETSGQRKDGTTVPLRLHVTAWGEPPDVHVTAVLRDLTQSEEYERALREAHARLQDVLDRMVSAQEDRRRQLAADIHDGLLQYLVGAELRLQAVRKRLAAGGAAPGDLDIPLERLRAAVDEGRRLIADLRPSTLDDFGLVEALRREVLRLQTEAGWEVSLEADLGDAKLAPDVETDLFRIAQECLNNAFKHSGADRVGVYLGRSGGEIRLRVQDWGRGFDPRGAEAGGGVGLAAIRERIRRLHGWSSLRSEPGRGAIVEVGLPG